jgi:sulfopyruvate decarboxylase subunit beta
VFDNQVLLSVGRSFTTATAHHADLAGLAAAAGVPRTARARTVEDFSQAYREAREAGACTTLVAKVDPVGPDSYFMDLTMLENRFEFQRYLARTAAP